MSKTITQTQSILKKSTPIRIHNDLVKILDDMKYDMRLRTFSDVIRKLIDEHHQQQQQKKERR